MGKSNTNRRQSIKCKQTLLNQVFVFLFLGQSGTLSQITAGVLFSMKDSVLMLATQPAILALADGSIFKGTSLGVTGSTVGEVVFNTAMTGYQEILSDPSYAQQIITLTYPHIGNVGVNALDMESEQVWAAGLVIRELSPIVSNWRAEASLPEFLQQHGVVAIADIDTRRLTRLLRDKGAQSGCIMAGEVDEAQAVAQARAFAGLEGANLASGVSRSDSITWEQPAALKAWLPQSQQGQGKRVVVYDFGVKSNILNLLVARGYEVIVVSAETPASDVLALNPAGVLLSNGPGDPAACDFAIQATQILLENNVPLFGICLGCQILALACGAQTVKMKFGHHGANHPVQNLEQRVAITSQNHGFSLDETTLPAELEVTHRSLFDGTVQGIRHTQKRAWAFQGHPEASPGPHDLNNFFDALLIEE
jgi:carbamoyl-phosphate synthase small subunit